MTRDEAKTLLPIIEAYANGKTIQCRNSNGWSDLDFEPKFHFADVYRIKPETKKVPMTYEDFKGKIIYLRWTTPANPQSHYLVTQFLPGGLGICAFSYSFEQLQEDTMAEWSTDCVNWNKFEKEV